VTVIQKQITGSILLILDAIIYKVILWRLLYRVGQ